MRVFENKKWKYISILTLILFFFFIPQIVCGSLLELSPHHEGVRILKRIQTRSGFSFFSQNFPQNMRYIQSYFSFNTLSLYDSYVMEHTFPWNQDGLFVWENLKKQRRLVLNTFSKLEGGRNISEDIEGNSLRTGIGLRLYGQINSNLSFFSEALIYQERTKKPQFLHQFDPTKGETCATEQQGNEEQKSRTCARYTSYLFLDIEWAQFKIGRDYLHMGPGYFSSLMFTRDTPPYYLINMRIPFSNWLYIDNYLVKMVDSDHSTQKYAHIHRFELKPTKSLSIAFQDMVLYSGRSIDYQYALPLTPLLFVEDNTGGRDNDALSFDFMYSGVPYISFWGELFIDDLISPTSFFDDFWENRWAVLYGFQVISPWERIDGDIVLEWSRVEPWTYLGRNSSTSFRHFNVPSASQLGPDSWTLDIQVSYRPWKYLEWIEAMKLSRKGTQDGAILGNVHSDEKHGLVKNFLSGNVLTRNIWIHELKYKYQRYLAGSFGVTQDLLNWKISTYWVEINLEW